MRIAYRNQVRRLSVSYLRSPSTDLESSFRPAFTEYNGDSSSKQMLVDGEAATGGPSILTTELAPPL